MKINCEIGDADWSEFLFVMGMGMSSLHMMPAMEGQFERVLQVMNKLNESNPNYRPYKNAAEFKSLSHLKGTPDA